MSATRPTGMPGWASGASGWIVEPPALNKALGWQPNVAPLSGYQNWLQNLTYGWLQFLDGSALYTDGSRSARHMRVDGSGIATGVTGAAGTVYAKQLLLNASAGASASSSAVVGLVMRGPTTRIVTAQFPLATVTAGAGAGAGPAGIASNGGDLGGQIQITTGSAPTGANNAICTLNFGATFPLEGFGPIAILQPANAMTAKLSGQQQVYVGNFGAQGFQIIAGVTGLTASTAYAWNYLVVNA